MRSLQSRFILTSVIAVTICLGIAGAALLHIFAESYSSRVQKELTGHINRLAAVIRFAPGGAIEAPEGGLADNRSLLPYGGLYWQIDDPASSRELRSPSLFDYALPLPRDAHPVGVMHQYRLPGPEGRDVLVQERVLALNAPEGVRAVRIAVAVDAEEVDTARAAFALDILPYVAVLAALLVLMSIGQLWIGLRPLERIGRDLEAIRDRRANRLAGTYPREIQPLVDRLNRLLESQTEIMEKARGRASDLAHGLKTPLTVLTNNALTLRDKGEIEMADELDHLADAMLSHVEHELARARITPSPEQRSGDADVARIIRETIHMLQHTEAGERLIWRSDVPDDMTVPLDPHDFRELAGNLLENAAKWARAEVVVTATKTDDGFELKIEDDGPGAAPERLADLPRRGLRLDLIKPGSGLGLAIVSEIASVYGLKLTLDNREEGGFRARVASHDPASQ
ncbi:HAMP domain-containing sensor histidine kinase [Rhizobium sp. FKL33]|uniref:sensor histidine kinase n=1 Tax=Rhizobium sp. FKL33 TaxID=2562307 RepID=UPI0010BFDE1F|nr:HAMP domain-containing sensor histidine kinase [Rhizobium sp. FKL33]